MKLSKNTEFQIPQGSLISYMSNLVKAKGGINCAQGLPSFSPPKELLRILSNISQDNIHQYAPGNGDNELMEIILKKHKNQDIKKENLLIVNGATEAISLIYLYLYQKFNQSFSTLAFEPVYESYSNLPKIYSMPFFSFSLGKNGEINFEKLKLKIKEENIKLLFISSPGNPFGKVFSKTELEKLLEYSIKFNFYIVFDAVYSELFFEDKIDVLLDKNNENLFFVNSFSKMLSITGWRIGYLISTSSHVEKLKSIHDYTGLSSPSILQKTIAYYLKNNNFADKYLENLRNEIKTSFLLMKQLLEDSDFFIPKTQGGYFVWCELPKKVTLNSFEFTLKLFNEKRVAVVPGIHFSKKADNFIRINIAKPQKEIYEAGKKIISFSNQF